MRWLPAAVFSFTRNLDMASPELDLAGKSLLIFDDGLRSVDGYWYEYDRAVAAIHTQRGAGTTIIANRALNDVTALEDAGARVLPVVEQSFWTGTGAGAGALGELALQWRLAKQFRAVLGRLLEQDAYDCVFHPNALLADVLAWRMIPHKLRRRARRVVLLTRFGLGEYRTCGPPLFARKWRVWRWLLRGLKADLDAGSMVLLTDSGRLADEYAKVSGVRPGLICSPRTLSPKAPRPPSSAVHFGTFGAARMEKGIDVFQAAIEHLIERGAVDDMRFTLQWNRPVPMNGGGLLARSPVAAAHPHVTFIEDALSPEGYEATMDALDCMVLPYRRTMYHSQISGVAVEAACAGIPMIHTADCWLSDFVAEQGAGIAVPDGDAIALADAITTMARDFPAYKAKARERSVIAREMNSSDRFASVLWGRE